VGATLSDDSLAEGLQERRGDGGDVKIEIAHGGERANTKKQRRWLEESRAFKQMFGHRLFCCQNSV